jgi:hypothetical protein
LLDNTTHLKAEEDNEAELDRGPARGLAWAMVLALLAWAGIGWMVWHYFWPL